MRKPGLEQIAEAVKNAPSIFDCQPWELRKAGEDRIELYARRVDRRDEVDQPWWNVSHGSDGARCLDPLARELAISCGAALYNLRLAIRVAGHDSAVRPQPHPTRDSPLLASVEIMTGQVKAPSRAQRELYEAIWRCPVDRGPCTIAPAPLPIIVAMEEAAAKEGASLRLLHPGQARNWQRLAGRRHRFERPPGHGKEPAGHPQLMVLSTDDDQVLDWLRAGQALQHAILTATRYSMSPPYVSLLSGSLLSGSLLSGSPLFGRSAERPRVVIRVGYAAAKADAVRAVRRRSR